MGDSLAGDGTIAGVVLAAGAGTRLRPLTTLRPKALCPVGGETLLDLAVGRLRSAVPAVAVNAHHRREQVVDHVSRVHGDRVHVSVEDVALGTAGALGRLRPWLDGRAALVVNADTWTDAPLALALDGWDGTTVRVLVSGPPVLAPRSRIVASLIPPSVVATLPAEPSGLYEVCWRPADAAGELEVVGCSDVAIDCGTPRGYLDANLASSGGRSVVGAGAVVEGDIERCVVWDGSRVERGERLVDAVRAGRVTVLVR